MTNKIFSDEIIARQANEMAQIEKDKLNIEEEVVNNIDDGFINIEGRKIEFEERVIVENKVKIVMPKDFTNMSEEVAKMKYPDENRPDYIFTNEMGSINITFNYFDENVAKSNDIEKARNLMVEVIVKMNPSIKIEVKEVIETSENKVYYFEFINPALDCEIYNIMFFVEIKERLLMGTFNCMVTDMYDWKPVAKQIIETIKESKKLFDGGVK